MDGLFGQQLAPEKPTHNQPVFGDVLRPDRNKTVAFAAYVACTWGASPTQRPGTLYTFELALDMSGAEPATLVRPLASALFAVAQLRLPAVAVGPQLSSTPSLPIVPTAKPAANHHKPAFCDQALCPARLFSGGDFQAAKFARP
jgi:hypothetical protein